MGLDSRVIVITGGARGYGRALVHGLLAEQARVVALDIAWEGAELSEEMRCRDDLLTLTADVTDQEQLENAYRATIDAFGTMDVIVNNAAMLQRHIWPSGMKPVLDSDIAVWERMLAVNTLGPLKVIRQFIGPMLEKSQGSIINVSSGSGTRGRAGDQPYGASKAALTNWSNALADELKPINIAVNVVFPPAARTTGYEEQERERAAIGLVRERPPTRPEAMVPIVIHLAQQDASGETGQVFHILEWNEAHGFGGPEAWAGPL